MFSLLKNVFGSLKLYLLAGLGILLLIVGIRWDARQDAKRRFERETMEQDLKAVRKAQEVRQKIDRATAEEREAMHEIWYAD